MRLKTDYTVGEIPHAEYPRPQLRRKNWLCLNGEWEFAKVSQGETPQQFGKILVPFSPETLLSGVEEGFVLQKGEQLVYKRRFTLPKIAETECVYLHFGAVDSECEVFVNDTLFGGHGCGFTAFSLDITSALQTGENEIRVEVKDENEYGAKGKQSKRPGKIWYHPQSGIWQTVWLEILPQKHIENLKFYCDTENKTLRILAQAEEEITATVFDGEKEIAQTTFTQEGEITYDFTLWSPENPKLYDIVLKSGEDEVKSYFGMRSFGIATDGKGKKRLTLNGKPYFFTGVLDQGYWSDGGLTYPSDKAVENELSLLKEMGFNTVRKHIKIEPMRWYYHCDKLGLVVWQDFVNGGGEYDFFHIGVMPFLGFHHRDDRKKDYKYFAREDERGRAEFLQMAKDTVEQLFNCVSIGMWVPFNEGWGQFNSYEISKLVETWDSSRVIDSVSGWHDQGKEKTMLCSLHTYYTPLRVPKAPRPVVLSEFGGYSMKISGHVYDESKEFGYKKFREKEKLEKALEKLYQNKVLPLIKKGLCACIYTQVSDVEEEINGLVTFDRKVVKVSPEKMRAYNLALIEESEKIPFGRD